jgi:cytochrome c biogenesis protein CcdA
MTSEITAYVRAQAKSAVRRAVTPAAFGLVAGLFVLFAVAGLFAALFFWFEPEHGPIASSLVCAAVALVLGIISAAPLLLGRRRPPPPAQPMLPQFVSLMARTAPGLGLRQLVVAGALLGVTLALSARGAKK